MKYEGEMDKECLALCDALNRVPGIRTAASCCGHGKGDYHIWFVADSLEALPDVLYWFDGCHCGFYNWRVEVTTDCAKHPVHFMVTGVGEPENLYGQAAKIATLLDEDRY